MSLELQISFFSDKSVSQDPHKAYFTAWDTGKPELASKIL